MKRKKVARQTSNKDYRISRQNAGTRAISEMYLDQAPKECRWRLLIPQAHRLYLTTQEKLFCA
ncbi:MAG: hypothetical protein AAFW66_13125, partial [Pseudomonadota bacterium]